MVREAGKTSEQSDGQWDSSHAYKLLTRPPSSRTADFFTGRVVNDRKGSTGN